MPLRYADLPPTEMAVRRAAPASRTGSPAFWLFLFIGCACMFVVGVVVGRNTAPVNFETESLDQKLSALPTSVLTEADAAAEDPVDPAVLEEIPFEFYDKLREEGPDQVAASGGPPPLKRPRFEKKTVPGAALADATAPAPSRPDQSGTAEPAGTGASPQKAEPPSVPGSGYAIQVASLRDAEKAAAVRDKFRSKGYPAYTQQAVVEGKGQWCRVRLGPYADKAQAENDLNRLQKAGVDAILFFIDANSQ